MKTSFKILTALFGIFSVSLFAQSTIEVGKEFVVNTSPAEAVIYSYTGEYTTESQIITEVLSKDINASPYYKRLGDGTYTLETKDYEKNQVLLVAIKKGFVPVVRQFSYSKNVKKEVVSISLVLSSRIFRLDAEPFDADIYVDGEKIARPYPFYLQLNENTSKTVQVKREGYLSIQEVFYNISGKPEPPLEIKTFTLTDRVVQIKTSPAEGTSIYLNGKKVGESHGDVVIKNGDCAVVKIQKEGFVEIERTYCNKQGSPEPPQSELINLTDREIAIRAPEGATIKVNGKEVGTSQYTLKLVKGGEAKIEVEKKGYVGYATTLYNNDNEIKPPSFIAITQGSSEFPEDESFTSSTESDLANRDFVLSTPEGMSEEDAWRIVAQIIQTYFDELEQIDRETGYLRTAWVYKSYANRTVRTRVILKINNREPLKYSLKISSEENSDKSKLDSRDDDDYKAWDRVLNQYKELISEMQSRLR